jgi:NTE family protein
MLQALAARRIRPDLLVGTSAGALNAAFIAGHGVDDGSLRELERIWTGMRRRNVFPVAPVRALAAAAGTAPSLCSASGLRRLIERNVTYTRIEDAAIPLHIVTTDVCSGEEIVLTRGHAVDAVLASASIPGVFPAVQLGGRHLVDGGVANNAAVSEAVASGADRVYVLPSGYACALERPPGTVLASALQAVTLLIEQRLILEVAQYAAHVDVRVLPPLCPLRVSAADFRHGSALIERAREASGRWLDRGGHRLPHPERFLSLHTHGARTRAAAECPGGHAA